MFQYVDTGTELGFKDVTSEMGLQFTVLADFNKTINASWGDYDGDSFVDLLIVQNTVDTEIGSEKLRLLHNDGGTGFSNLGYQVGFSEDKSGILSIIWADLDQDHDVELLLVQALEKTTGPISMYYENKYHDLTMPTLVSVPEKITEIEDQWNYNSNLAVCSDYNNDGRLDLAYYNRDRFGFGVTNDTGTILDSWFWTYGGNDPLVHDLAVFDADHNGHNDLMGSLRSGYSRFPRLWLSDGNTLRHGTQTLIVENGVTPNDQQGMCVGDFTRDGNTEIFLSRSLTNVDDGAFFYDIYNPEGTTTNWVGFSLEAPNGLCNRMALGATVVVSSSDLNDGFVQAKLVDGGGGRASQADRLMVFGLGDYTGNVDVEITLPNRGIVSGGSTIMYTNLPIGQYHDLQMQLLGATEVSTQMSHNAQTGKITLDVTWSTDSPTIWNNDMVRFHSTADDALVPSQTVHVGGIDPEQSTGPYPHHMIIIGLPCDSSKSFYISVQSDDGSVAQSSSVVEVPIKKCLIPGDISQINQP